MFAQRHGQMTNYICAAAWRRNGDCHEDRIDPFPRASVPDPAEAVRDPEGEKPQAVASRPHSYASKKGAEFLLLFMIIPSLQFQLHDQGVLQGLGVKSLATSDLLKADLAVQ